MADNPLGFYKGVSVLLTDRLRAAYSIDIRSLPEKDAKIEMDVLEKRYDEIQHRLGVGAGQPFGFGHGTLCKQGVNVHNKMAFGATAEAPTFSLTGRR